MKCFVIQPFDAGKFDKRFDDVYKPAIEGAGLDAYRVDRDPRAAVPIDAIESGIRSAAVCLADITADKPNVWYELGFAFASGKQVVLVCSQERTEKGFPFDVQHRSVILYRSEAPSDFDKLRQNITARLEAYLEKGAALRQMAAAEMLAPVEGLSQPELVVLSVVAGNIPLPNDSTALYTVQRETEEVGLTRIGLGLGLRRLLAKQFIEISEQLDQNADTYQTVSVTEAGWAWVDANENLFLTRHDGKASSDEDLPF